RRIRGVELSWRADARHPSSDEIEHSYFGAADDAAQTWCNPRTMQEAGKPEVSADGHTYVYMIPVDTWGVVAALRGKKGAAGVAVPSVHAFVPDRWKELDLEIEWGFDARTASLAYDGELEAYDAVLGDVQP